MDENHSLSETSFVSFGQNFPDFSNNVYSVFRWLHFLIQWEKRFEWPKSSFCLAISLWQTSVS